MLSEEFVKKFNIETSYTSAKIQIANNNPVNCNKIINDAEVIVKNHEAKVNFLVCDLPYKIEALLGIDWMDQMNLILYMKERKIVLNPIEYEIEEEADPYIEHLMLAASDNNEYEFEDEMSNYDPTFIDENFKIPHLNKAEEEKVISFLNENEDLFARSYSDLGKCTLEPFEINLEPGVKPIYVPPYRKSQKERQALNEEIEKMLQAGIIRTSKSPWSAPVVTQMKPDGTLRMCVDFRKLNAKTILNRQPIPLPKDIFDQLAGSQIFTKLDLKSGYWQIPMHEDSIPITAFSTQDGHYECMYMAFGLTNAPSHFAMIMRTTYYEVKCAKTFFDDITTHSANFDTHLEDLKTVFECLRKSNLKLNFKKCEWFQDEIFLLGHVINGTNLKMNPKKVDAVKSALAPKNIKHVQKFIGLANYYRRFIKQFSHIAKPLYDLLKKNRKWSWGEIEQNAFNTLKDKLCEYPIVRLPDIERPFILHTDASNIAIGAILAQKDDNNAEYVIEYASKSLKSFEMNFGITEKECLAVVWAIKYFHYYLFGVKFTVVTDHSALHWLLTLKKDPTGRLARWSTILQSYKFEVIHRKGKLHNNVDAISRPVLLAQAISNSELTEFEMDANTKNIDPYDDSALIYYLENGKFKTGISKKQKQRINKLAEKYKIKNNKLYHINETEEKEVPRKEERLKLTKAAHEFGHFQSKATYDRLGEEYYWPKMMKDVETIVKNCNICIRNEPKRIMNNPAIALPITGLFDRVGIDLVFGLKETPDGYKGILLVTDYLSKYPYAAPIKSKTANEIAEQLWIYITIFGPPKEMLSDQGPEFLNKIVEELAKITGIKRSVTAPYHPRTNGLVERFNQTLINMLRKFTDSQPDEWIYWLPFSLLSYRTKVHETTNISPYQLVFSKRMNHFKDWKIENTNTEELELIQRANEIRNQYESVLPNTLDIIEKKQEKQKKYQNQNQNNLKEPLKIGTMVYIRNMKIKNKLEPLSTGPFKISNQDENGNYILENAKGKKLKGKGYPPCQLIVSTATNANESSITDEENFEVEDILDCKLKRGIRYYLVKWKDYSEEDNSWVKESNFDTPEIIQEYWNKIVKEDPEKYNNLNQEQSKTKSNKTIAPTNETNPKSQRSSKRLKEKMTKTSILAISNPIVLLTLISFLLINTCTSIVITQPLDYCNTEDYTLLNTDLNCHLIKPYNNFKIDKWSVLNRKKYLIDGYGYLCKKYEISKTTYRTFFGSEEIRARVEIPIELSKTACEYMVYTKLCDDEIMSCNNEYCEFASEPYVGYYWLNERTYKRSKCFFKRIQIQAKDMQDIILYGSHGPCFIHHLYCQQYNQIIIWNKNISHNCNFEFIKEDYFAETDQNLISVTNATYLQFRKLERIDECGLEIYTTTVGLFVTKDKIDKNKIESYQPNLAINEMLIMSDSDRKFQELITMLNLNIKNIELFECYILNTIFNIINVKNLEVRPIFIQNGKKLFIQGKNNTLFNLKCKQIDEIKIINNSKYCFYDIPIKYNDTNITKTGFLNQYNIIIDKSFQVTCNNSRINIINSTLAIIYEGNNVKFYQNNINNIIFNYSNDNNLQFKHDTSIKYIIENNNNIIEDSNGQFQIYKSHEIFETDNNMETISYYFKYMFSNFFKISITLSIIIIIISSIIVFNIIKNIIKPCIIKKKLKSNN